MTTTLAADPRPGLYAQRRDALTALTELATTRRHVFALWPTGEAEAKAAEVDALIAQTLATIDHLEDQICERPT